MKPRKKENGFKGQVYIAFASLLLIAALIFNLAFDYQGEGANPEITGNAISNYEYDVVIDDDFIVVPVRAHLIREQTNVYSTLRNENNVRKTFAEVNRIWEPAKIYFDVQEIVVAKLKTNDVPTALTGNALEIYNSENFDRKKINVFFAQRLNGINGIALANINSVLVADITTVNDYRTTAHELGHLLNLAHVSPNDRLMARGRNGEILSEEEIEIAQNMAMRMLNNNFFFDETEISISEYKDYGNLLEAQVEVFMRDNNNNADADGGKIIVKDTQIVSVQEIDWESNCEKREDFEYECIIVSEDGSEIQWFNFVQNDADRFSFTIRFPKKGANSLLILEETGGMECGAYYQTAQTGPYLGYQDGSGGLSCAARITSLNGENVFESGGFPLKISLSDLFEGK